MWLDGDLHAGVPRRRMNELMREAPEGIRPDGARVRVLGIETSCDETGVAVVEDGRVALRPDREPGGPARPVRRRGPRDREPGARRGAQPAHGGGARARRLRVRATSTAWPSRSGRASSARCWSGSPRPRRWRSRPGAPLVGVNHLEGHVYANFLEHEAPLVAGRLPRRLGRAHDAAPHARGASVPRARADRRRRRGRGVRQDRPVPGARASPAAPRSTGWPAREIRRPIAFPRAMADLRRLRLLALGLEDLGPAAREGRSDRPGATSTSRTWPPRSRRRSSTCRSPRRCAPRPSARSEPSCWAAASSRTRGCASGWRARAEARVRVLFPSLALCTDNGAMIAVAGASRLARGERTPLDVGVDPALELAG